MHTTWGTSRSGAGSTWCLPDLEARERWRYGAHLPVLRAPYCFPATLQRRRSAASLRSGAGVLVSATRPNARARHCLCTTRALKTLADRTHLCPVCGLIGDRDRVAAALGAFVTVLRPLVPDTAWVDHRDATLVLTPSPGPQAAPAGSGAAPPEQLKVRRDGGAHARRGAGSAPPPTPDESPVAPPRAHQAGAPVLPAGLHRGLTQGQDSWPGALSSGVRREACPRRRLGILAWGHMRTSEDPEILP